MVVPVGAVLLPPLDSALLLLLLLGLLFHGGGQGHDKAGALQPLRKPGDAPHIGLDGGQLFPILIQQMDGAVGSQPHGSYLPRRKFPFPAPAADVQHGVVPKHKQSAVASGQQHPRPQQEQQHAGNCHEGGNTRLKGRRSGHDDPHEGQDESKCPYNYAENRDHHPLPHDHQRQPYFLRFSVAAQQQCQAESEQI